MATAISTPFPQTGDRIVDAITNGGGWLLDSSRTIKWSVSDGFNGEHWASAPLVQQYTASALSVFSYFANVSFTYVGYFTTPSVSYSAGADINLSLSSNTNQFPSSSIWALGYFPTKTSEVNYVGQAGDVYLNTRSAANSLPSYEPGSAGWFVLIHELGHALGLKHTHDNGGTGRPLLTAVENVLPDTDWVSIMSYNDDRPFDLIHYDPATPMIIDVIGLQALYGINPNTNLGDTVYQLDSNASLYYSIWDAGGAADRLDASSSGRGWQIVMPNFVVTNSVPQKFGWATPLADLASSSPSSFVWIEGNIENASGSNFSDKIFGNSLNNSVNGNNGLDTFAETGSRSQYVVTKSGNLITVSDGVGGRDGIDTLTNIERVRFLDKILAFDTSGNAGQGYRLYQAAFNRTPDQDGVSFWINQIDQGTSLQAVAQAFVTSAEFRAMYGSNPPSSALAAAFYTNVLGRAPDPSGLSFWVNLLQNGTSISSVLASFSESSENQAHVAPAIANGISLSLSFFA